MKKFEIIMKITSLLFVLFFFFMLKNSSKKPERFLSNNGLYELNHTKNTISELAQSLNAKLWDYGDGKYVEKNAWVYVGAYITLPKCIEYYAFKEALYNQGFNQIGNTSYYCKKDVSITDIRAEKNMDYGVEADKKYYICGKISFSISWRQGEHKNNPKCLSNP
ncbi:hypothetical protein PL75_04165 [Neisseria arctica]|uniref:Uncharacterized protein n=1 Tax=Neisseria arctica TaxID=1470200 RepID=A0A0J1C481_9NEIS|nr:hypothetical protein [Neisseria arctica]KLT73113.1 hypothetical protein PL75_04165 [Neisseria arctica]UOO87162.1 hypothetical protein LVJ86_02620 [Neisseria arctica]